MHFGSRDDCRSPNGFLRFMHTILFEEFVNVKAGEPYRLFPFGTIVKNGKKRNINPEYAATIRLPHFKPAIKLGSHEDSTPAGGHIQSLEVRGGYYDCDLCLAGKCKSHGLFVVPEWNGKGGQAIQDGDYRYHSPEMIWDGGLEDPTNGEVINAPLLVGDALLHTPHLGEAAALYSVEEITQENTMNGENFTFPKSIWENYIAPLLSKPAEKVEVVKTVEPEDYSAIKAENEKYKAQIERQQAEAARKARVDKFDAEIKETKADPTLSELLADLPEEKAELIMKQFRGLSEQIKESNLTEEHGSAEDGASVDAKTQFNAIATKVSLEQKINYNDAFAATKLTHPELFAEAFGKK